MADHLIRGFRDQLNTVMDSVLKTAVSEAMKIFENVLCGYQMELVQKGEEVAQLKIKLRRTELKLKEHEVERSKEPERNQREEQNRKDGTEPQNKVGVDAPRHTSDVPEIDFEGTVMFIISPCNMLLSYYILEYLLPPLRKLRLHKIEKSDLRGHSRPN